MDFLEIISENFMDFGGRPREVVKAAKARFPQDPNEVSGFILDLAELEWREWEGYAAPDDDTKGTAGTTLNPTLVILQLDWPAHAFLNQWRASVNSGKPSPAVPEEPSAETVFVFRHPRTCNIVSVEAREDLLFVLNWTATTRERRPCGNPPNQAR